MYCTLHRFPSLHPPNGSRHDLVKSVGKHWLLRYRVALTHCSCRNCHCWWSADCNKAIDRSFDSYVQYYLFYERFFLPGLLQVIRCDDGWWRTAKPRKKICLLMLTGSQLRRSYISHKTMYAPSHGMAIAGAQVGHWAASYFYWLAEGLLASPAVLTSPRPRPVHTGAAA